MATSLIFMISSMEHTLHSNAPSVVNRRQVHYARYTIFNHTFLFPIPGQIDPIPANPADYEFGVNAFKKITEFLADGKSKSNPVIDYPGGRPTKIPRTER